MKQRRLGQTDLLVSPICLGTMQFGWSADETTSFAILDAAVDAGCNFLDSAEIYSAWAPGNSGGESETIIGNWLAREPHKRDQVVIATKVRGAVDSGPGAPGLTREHIIGAAEASLRRLRVDVIDLYQVHWPNEETPLAETLEALDELVAAGKVRWVGCSNHPAPLLAKALALSAAKKLVRYESLQPHYNFLHRQEFEEALQALCREQNVGVIPYSPLANGFLTGKYRRDESLPDSPRAAGVRRKYMNERGFAAVAALEAVANEAHATIPQVAIAWLLANPVVTSVIVGANNVAQLHDSMAGAALALSAKTREHLDQVTAWAPPGQPAPPA